MLQLFDHSYYIGRNDDPLRSAAAGSSLNLMWTPQKRFPGCAGCIVLQEKNSSGKWTNVAYYYPVDYPDMVAYNRSSHEAL